MPIIDDNAFFRQFINSQRKEIDALHDHIFELKKESYQSEGRIQALRDYVQYLESMIDTRNEIINTLTKKPVIEEEICL
jgi:hypothetical protein